MAKKTRIPELVVGKIYIDGGDKDKVYTIGSDENGALRIGDSRSNSVATIDQKTGKIVANSFAGDGSALEGISSEGLADLQTARLLTLSADKLFFNYDADGVAKVTDPAQTITLTAKTQNITNPTFNWFSNEITPVASGDNGELLVIDLNQMGNNEFVTVTVEVDNESLSESTTIFRLQEGRTGRNAVTVAMVNPTVTYQATLVDGDTPDIPEDEAAFMAAGEANITVRYGATKLTPVTGNPGDNEFTVTVASSEYVTVPTDPSYIAPDTANKKMDIGAPANVIAQVGTITFDVTAQVDGETYSFTQIQNFNLNVPGQVGASGEGAKFVKLTSNDYQFAYNSDGLQADPLFVTLTADAQNHGDNIYYRWFIDDVPWAPGTAGAAINPTPDPHLYTTGSTNSIKLNAASSHGAYGFKKVVRVETQTSTEGDPIASDSVSVIATKDGSNAIQIAADNLTHGFPANSDGTIDSLDYDDGAVTFQVYHGNTNMTPNMTVAGTLKTLIQGTAIGSSPGQSDINNAVASLNPNEFAVLADATTATIDSIAVNTIDPFGSAPQSVTDVTGDKGIKFFPNNMQVSLRRAAINYTFYLRTADGQLAASTVRTQSFVKGRDGAQGMRGPDGVGKPGTDAKATKLTLDDYQVGFDENGGNPQTLAGDGTITANVSTQGHDEALTIYRISVDDVPQDVQNGTGTATAPWEQYKWKKLTSGTPWYGAYQFDFSVDEYNDWSLRKKVIKVETTQLEYTDGNLTSDVANLSLLAEDSVTIIATKEGSNAVEVFADNLSHQFIEDALGDIDYTEGEISFGVYIGNTQLTASTEQASTFDADGNANSFLVTCTSENQNNIRKGLLTRPDINTLKFQIQDNSFGIDDSNKSSASLTYTVMIKDATGTRRPDRTLVQSFTKTRDGSDSKLIRLDVSSRVFSFENDFDWTAEPSEVVFSVSSQNLAAGEEVGVGDIYFIDKDGTDVSSRVKDYINPLENGVTESTSQKIAAALALGSTFTMRFAQFQPLAKDDDGNYLNASFYTDSNNNPSESVPFVLQQLKKTAFPLTVRLRKTDLAGAVATITDELNLLSLQGGSNVINIDAPNAVHLLDANADMEVNNSSETLSAAGTDIDVYVGAAPLDYDSSAATLEELERGKYRFGDFIYGTKFGTGSGGNMITLAIRGDNTGVRVTAVSNDYTKQTVTLPVEVKRPDGTEETKNLILSYSKVKEGRDGENLKDRNFDFSQGPTGWSLDGTFAKGSDLNSVQLTVDSDEKANFGGSVGVFHFVDTAAATSPPTPNSMMDGAGKSKSIYISETLPVGATEEPGSDVDDGTWLIKFRAKVENHPDLAAGSSLKATNDHTSPIRAWLSIKPFSGDGTPYSPVPAVDNTSPLFYFDVPNTAWAAATTVYGELGFSTNDDAGYDYDDYSVPLLKDHYLTYVLRVTPAEIQTMMGTAASFKIVMRFKGAALGTDRSPLIKVDAFQAEKLPYSGIRFFDGEQYDRIQNNKLIALEASGSAVSNAIANSDLSDRFGHLVDENADAAPEVLFNGKLNILLPTDSYPQGVLISAKNTNATPARDTTSGFLKPGSQWALMNASGTGNSTYQRGLFFKAVKIPSPEHKMNIKLTYHRSTNDSDSSYPSVYVYFHDDDLPAGKKYIVSSTTTFNFSNTSDGVASNVLSQTNNPNIYHSGGNLTETGTESNPITKAIGIEFGDDGDVTNGTGSPKWASIAIFGASSGNTSDLFIHELALEWDLQTTTIVGRATETVFSDNRHALVSGNASNALANAGVAQSAANLAQSAATTAQTTADGAQTTADGAQTTANTANSTANTVNGRFGGPGNRLTSTYATNNPPESVGYSQAPPTSPQPGDMVHIEGDDETPGGLWRYTGIGSGDPWTSATQTVAGVDIQWYDFQLGQENFESNLWTARGTAAPGDTEKWPETSDMIFEQGTGGIIRYTNSFYGAGNINRFNKTGLVVRSGTSGVFTFRQPFYGNVRLHIEYMTTAKSGTTYSRDSTPASNPYMFVHTKTNDTNWDFNTSYKWYSQGSQVSDQLAGPEGHEYSYSSGQYPTQKTVFVRHARMFIEKTGKWYLKLRAGDTHDDYRPIIHRVGVEGWVPAKDFDTQAKVFELGSNASYNFLSFTGQHKCAPVSPEEQIQTGMIVSSTGQYDNFNYEKEEENSRRHKVNPKEAVPIVEVSKVEKDKKVVGVYAGEWERSKFKNKSFAVAGTDDTLITRYEINSLGEGGIWVSDVAGFLENGDYICSSNIPGYGMKQDDDILRNYTVAKITQDCLFDLNSEDYDCKEVEHDGTIYKVAFVGCTYHCG